MNECGYCQAAYTQAAQAAGFDLETTVRIRDGCLPRNPRLTALLRLARQIADRRGHVDQPTWDQALAAGWTHQQLLEAYAEVVHTILTNYFNHVVGTELDLPAAPPAAGGRSWGAICRGSDDVGGFGSSAPFTDTESVTTAGKE